MKHDLLATTPIRRFQLARMLLAMALWIDPALWADQQTRRAVSGWRVWR